MNRAANCLLVVLSYIGVFLVLYLEDAITLELPISVEITDSKYVHGREHYLCWINPDQGHSNYSFISLQASKGCDRLAPGFITNSFVGHQFLVVYNNRTVDHPPKIVTIQSSNKFVDIQHHINYDTVTNFDLIVEWQRLLLNRRNIASAVAVVLLIHLLLLGNTKKPQIITSEVSTARVQMDAIREPWVHRQWIKCYAVVNMLLNHSGYVFVRENKPMQTWFTLLADAGGSMSLFNWLIGYNTKPGSERSNNIMLLVAFLFLNTCVDLPPPITYETLLSIYLTRSLLQLDFLRVSASTGRCALAEAPIGTHAVLIALLQFAVMFLGTKGLKLIHGSGILYAINGRLFAVRRVDVAVRFLWLFVAVVVTLKSAEYSVYTVHKASDVQQWVYGGAFMALALLHALVVNGPAVVGRADSVVKGRARESVHPVAQWIAHYSFEIYVGHFLMLKALYELENFIGNN